MTTSKEEVQKSALSRYQEMIRASLNTYLENSKKGELYAPIHYLLKLGGKRLRPALVLAATDAFDGSAEDAVPAALAIEVFHNFTLMHDDIMDQAPLRRGFETVHVKWNTNAAILSGDTMLVQAYQLLAQSKPNQLPQLLQLFSTTAIEVCEGQQLDMEFENRTDVHVVEYIEMIRLKTSVLLAAALKTGALVANASEEDCEHIYKFGEQIGLAFQLRDDYLDAFGEQEKFGKLVGGDILADKKTFLWIRAHELASETQLEEISLALKSGMTNNQKVEAFKNFFETTGAREELKIRMQSHVDEAMSHLHACNLNENGVTVLQEFVNIIIHREE